MTTLSLIPPNPKPKHLTNKNDSVLQISGKASLRGEVRIGGAKNSALAIMAAALLCPGDCRIRNVPSITDVTQMGEMLSSLGVKWHQHGDIVDINARYISESQASAELVSQLRASFFAIGPLLARLGAVRMPLPGGCAIGARPVDLYLRGLQAMGAEIQCADGIVRAWIAGGKQRLQGARIHLDFPSVGATETLMMAATLAEGETIIKNAAREPEVEDLANFCRAMGARIQGAGTETIIITGVSKLHSADYSIIPDRIEAGTFLVAGAITRSRLSLTSVKPHHLTAVIAQLRSIGAAIFLDAPDRLRIVPGYPHTATAIETLPYPNFPTDMQAQFVALLTLCEGISIVTENIFENRLQHVAELKRMGADIRVKGNRAIIRGVSELSGAHIVATDLRAAAALVLAALAADGTTTIEGCQYLKRGYENFAAKLHDLGVNIHQRMSNV